MIGRLLVANAKMMVRNRQALFWALVFPLLFVVVFGLFRFDDIGEAEVAVFGDAATAAPIERAIEAHPSLTLDGFDSRGVALEGLEDGDVDLVLDIARGGAITVSFNEATADRNGVFIGILRAAIDGVNIEVSGIRRAYRMDLVGVQGIATEYFDFVLPGLVGMAVMTYGIIGLAGTIAQYRGQKILKRIRATPLRPSTFMAALVLAHLALAAVQSSIVLLVGTRLFGGSVRGNLLALYLFVILGNITFLNIGFMVASRVETAEAASGFGNAVAMPMMFFSGVFFPTAGLPWILPYLTSALPLRPMVDAIRRISIEGDAITSLGSEAAQLLAWALVTFLIAARVFRFERA